MLASGQLHASIRFIHRESSPGIHRIEPRVGPRAGVDALRKGTYSLRRIGASNAHLYTPRVRNGYNPFVSIKSSLFGVGDGDSNNRCHNHMRNVYFFCPWYFTHPINRHCFLRSSIGVTNGALILAHAGRHRTYKGISHPQIHSLWRWRLQRLSKSWDILTAIRDRPSKADPPYCLPVC